MKKRKGCVQTKIVPVICRDCKETMTILALAPSKIIEGRCPKCTKEFNKKQEEYNKSIGYPATLFPLSDLEIHKAALDASFGLEYLFHGEVSDRIVRLLEGGVKFCNNIVETKESETMKTTLQNTISDLKGLLNDVIAEKTDGKGYKCPYNEAEIRRIQHFFNTESEPYLQRASQTMRKKQRK